MQNQIPISCPINGIKVNEHVARTVALIVMLLSAIAIDFNFYIITLFLIFDFASRAFLGGNYSVLKLIAKHINTALKIKPLLTDEAPKKFAALLGFIFVNVIFVLQYFNFQQTATIVGLLLIVCAALEGFLAFCVGCVIFRFFEKLK